MARARRRGLTLERVVAGAVELADAEGLGAVSMARVAEQVGFTTMALYRHVRNKEELLQLMFDAAAGPAPELDPAAGWRTGLERWSRELLAALQRHPWTVQVPLSGPPTTPNRLGWFDRGLGALEGIPLEEHEKAAVILLFNGHVFWWARLLEDVRDVQPAEPAAAQAQVAGALEAADLPALQRALRAGVFTDEHDDFTFGLERILDGVERLVEQRA